MVKTAQTIKRLAKSFSLIDLFKGLKVTGGFFFAKKITVQYPEEETPASSRFRGMLALRRYANGEERCIACKLCEAVCPASAIYIEAAPQKELSAGAEQYATTQNITHNDAVLTANYNAALQKEVRRTTIYDLDTFKCIYCGLCEQACPVDAIVLTSESHYIIEGRGDNIFPKEKLLAIGDLYEAKIAADREENRGEE